MTAGLVLLHPTGFDSRIWDPVVPCLQREFTVVPIDRPGHGTDALPPDVPITPDELRAARARRRATSPPEVELVERSLVDSGHDDLSVLAAGDGGLVALQLACRGHVTVRALVTVDTLLATNEQLAAPGAPDLDAVADLADRMPDALAAGDTRPFVDWLMEQFRLDSTPEHVRTLLRSMLSDNILPALLSTGPGFDPSTSGVPDTRVLLLHTGRGLSGDAGETLRSAGFGDVTVEEVPGDPVLFPMTRPDHCCRRVVEHVRRR